ncbi:conjugal transfer protein TrbD [uncultured Vibrio sp.]|uniref:conjugal transfer protein TrbD n=1 Tax=uncultured Vibrio sp. TaxID=114054 RepID=UPI002612A90E|nr:conjugal transfer protein TrbD [uncultured Vibrio sp.]
MSDHDEALHVIPIYAFNRAHLVMGGEREIVMVSMLMALILVVLQNLYMAVLAVVLFFSMLMVARLMAKSDPVLTQVYRRYHAFQRFYPAHSVKYLHRAKAR